MAEPAVSALTVTPTGRPAFEVAYQRQGAGEPLVLLHGIGHHLQAWEPVRGALAASYDVIALDLPGFGASPALPAGHAYELDSVVDLLTEVFAALEVERPHLAGNSLGGLLALRLAERGAARSVTALSPAGFWTGPERRYAFGLLSGMYAAARALPDGTVRRLAGSPAGRAVLTGTVYARPGRRSAEAVVAETRAMRGSPGFRATLAAGRDPQVWLTTNPPRLPDIPVTLAWGDRDRLLPPRQGVRAKHLLPEVRLVRLRRCGHVPMNDDPAAVARVIADTARVADTAR